MWDANKGGDALAILRGHTGAVTGAIFSPDGKQILTFSTDKTARVWTPRTEQGPDKDDLAHLLALADTLHVRNLTCEEQRAYGVDESDTCPTPTPGIESPTATGTPAAIPSP